MTTKICSKCKQEKPKTDFHACKSKKDGLQTYCKKCLIENSKRDYKDNNRKKLFSDRATQLRRKCRNFTNNIKLDTGCCLCHENELCCLYFHHIDPSTKEADISYLAASKCANRLSKELKKCCVVCSNCHRKIHVGILSVSKKHLVTNIEKHWSL